MLQLRHKAYFFLLTLLLNFAWELSHCSLYITCIEEPYKLHLLGMMALKDSLLLTGLLLIILYFSEKRINKKTYAYLFILGIAISAILEGVSLWLQRWEYTPSMPTLFNIGISPLVQLAITSVLALWMSTHKQLTSQKNAILPLIF